MYIFQNCFITALSFHFRSQQRSTLHQGTIRHLWLLKYKLFVNMFAYKLQKNKKIPDPSDKDVNYNITVRSSSGFKFNFLFPDRKYTLMNWKLSNFPFVAFRSFHPMNYFYSKVF